VDKPVRLGVHRRFGVRTLDRRRTRRNHVFNRFGKPIPAQQASGQMTFKWLYLRIGEGPHDAGFQRVFGRVSIGEESANVESLAANALVWMESKGAKEDISESERP
jgi:hypothetical protein